MANIPGGSGVLPGVFTDIITQSSGVSIPGGARLVAMIGEGSTDDVIVSQAIGGGKDGLNSKYTSTTGADGRHFQLSYYPLISNRTTIYKNGIPLVGTESLIDDSSFSNKYDYRIDPTTGRIELQKAHIVDQGGSDYLPLSTNVGDGYLSSLTLVDKNAPPEVWTVRCVSVQRNVNNAPIASTAKFLAYGSVSGAKLDANGNPVVWIANGNLVSNGVISFSIFETYNLGLPVSPFKEGDAFIIKVDSGVLVRNDTLTANYIVESFLNNPIPIQGLQGVVERHGYPSVSNNLSLGAQLAFANNAPALITVQAKPSMPRRQSFLLADEVFSDSLDYNHFIFPLPPGVVPNATSSIHFFITNLSSNVETQILPNQYEYYSLDKSGNPTTEQFIDSVTAVPGGYSYCYTLVEKAEAEEYGFDGVLTRNSNTVLKNRAEFNRVSIQFDKTYIGKKLKIIDSVNKANNVTYSINSVLNGKLSLTADSFPEFTSQGASSSTASVSFQVIEPSTGLPITGAAATDGDLIALLGTSTATLTCPSSSLDFSTISNLINKRIKINGSALGNNGLYDISAVDILTNTITLEMAVVNESNLRFEIIDLNNNSVYVVINKNVVPPGHSLRVTLIDTKEANFYDAGWIDALESLETVECDIVVPLPKQTISVILQNTLSHCKAMSNIRNKKERIMLAGAIKGLKPENVIGTEPAAVEDIGLLEGIQGDEPTEIMNGNIEDLADYSVSKAFGNTYRAVYFYPDEIYVQASGETISVSGMYLAAAAAGYLSADTRIENPLTNKTLSGFTILRNKQFSTLTLENLAGSGITTVQPVAGGGRVVWGITTSQSGFPEEQEISIVFIRDRVAKSLRAGFAGYIGLPESQDTGAILNTRAVILLNSFIAQGLITAYADLAVKRDDADPTQWNISVRVQPTYPVNFIYIKVALGKI